MTFPTQILMLSLALAHDVERLDLTSVVPGQDLTGFNDGNGPEFFAPFETPDGFTLGIVFSFLCRRRWADGGSPARSGSGHLQYDSSCFPPATAPAISPIWTGGILLLVLRAYLLLETPWYWMEWTGILPITAGARLDLVTERVIASVVAVDQK